MFALTLQASSFNREWETQTLRCRQRQLQGVLALHCLLIGCPDAPFDLRHPPVTFWTGWLIQKKKKTYEPYRGMHPHLHSHTQRSHPLLCHTWSRSQSSRGLCRLTSSPGVLRPSFTQRFPPPFIHQTKTVSPSPNVFSYMHIKVKKLLYPHSLCT